MQRRAGSRSLDVDILRTGSGLSEGVADDQNDAGQAVAAGLRCRRCRVTKAESDFSKDSSRPSGRFPWCKSCQVEYAKENRWQKINDDLNGHTCPLCDTPCRGHKNRRYCSASCKERASALRGNFGLSVADYRKMVEATGGVCPICLEPTTVWHVDHIHATGVITGVVCNSCNIGAISRTFHDPAFIRRLLDYVERPPAVGLGIGPRKLGALRPANLHTMWNRDRKTMIAEQAQNVYDGHHG